MPKIVIADDFQPKAKKLLKKHPEKVQKIKKTIAQLGQDPGHPGLRTNKYDHNQNIWQSYVENNVSSAWRIWWVWSQNTPDTIVVIGFGPHP